MAWAAKTSKLGLSPMDIPEDVEVYFAFGDTSEGAIMAVEADIDAAEEKGI